MSDISIELDLLHASFLRALNADPEPLAEAAAFWYEAIAVDRNPEAPSARCRGTSFMHYKQGPKQLRDVPGQTFATDALPAKVCTRLISAAAASWDGPRAISFRYDRVDGVWTGGYAIETSAEYRDQVTSRRDLDGRLAEALRDHWTPGITTVALLYGVGSWTEFGPKIKVVRGKEKPEFVPPSEGVMSVWSAFRRHIERDRWRLDYANLTQEKAGAALKEGDNVQVRYGR